TLHEATLQELIHAKNYTILHILHEHNELFHQQNSVHDNSTSFPEFDFISPTEASTCLYAAVWFHGECHVLQSPVKLPSWASYPVDGRHFEVSTQMDDPNATLVEVNIPVLDNKLRTKKRKSRN
ncbi:hypothetical protein BJY52DRAFT_1226230, partial [Lactarius psammicola]